ncbi:MAG: 16S rRNA (uracil(1498)-N(3))-methyltransferase [Verrucomicrobia bacterium]|nr:MAG: 16S rRNA (uracil(1498)-N(3))-methyltransferase [Verrucomicrobiota bacterium]
MHRFYITPENWNADALILRESEVHHARDVLRLEPGERVVVFNGRGHEVTAEITKVAREEIQLRKLHEVRVPPLRCQITLAQAIPKWKNMDLIVQKAVELGAAEIAPIISDRTIVHLQLKEAVQKQAKWQQVAIEAAKQCGQNWLPAVQMPRKLKEFFATVEAGVSPASNPGMRPTQLPLQHADPELRLIGSLQSDAVHLKTVLAEYERENQGGRPTNVLMCIGPEGDFTPAELNLARSHGCRPITLGPIILRVETAAIYCLSVLSYELLAEP